MIRDQLNLDGRRALVTGASDGIGKAIALGLAEFGCEVACHGLEADAAEQVCAEALRFGGRAHALAADLAQPHAGLALAEAARRTLGHIDILVSCVAVQTRAPFAEVTPSDLEIAMRVNFQSTFELMQATAPPMASVGWGRILAIGSVQQAKPHPYMPIYAALKAAQVNLIRNLARQLAPRGVTANVIAPGVFDTPRNAAALADEGYRASVLAQIPAGRIGAPWEIALLAVLLCSNAGAFVTGQDIFVDGGMSA